MGKETSFWTEKRSRRWFLRSAAAFGGMVLGAELLPIANALAQVENLPKGEDKISDVLQKYPFMQPHFLGDRSRGTDALTVFRPVPYEGWGTALNNLSAYDPMEGHILYLHDFAWRKFEGNVFPYDPNNPMPPLREGEELRFYEWYEADTDTAHWPNGHRVAVFDGFAVMDDQGLADNVYGKKRNCIVSCWGSEGLRMVTFLKMLPGVSYDA